MNEQHSKNVPLLPFRDPQVAPEGGDPYTELAPFGVDYSSSMAQVHRGGLEAQRRRLLTSGRTQAWRELRSAEKRLLVDLLYYQPDPAVFGAYPAGPATQIDPWLLLHEAWDTTSQNLPELAPPVSFLEEE